MKTFVLMYHRVCERSPATEPWFARGTAVTPRAFFRQMVWLSERFKFIEGCDVFGGNPEPAVVVTFDDGYADILDHVVPVCDTLALKPVCFAAAGPVLYGATLWIDAWYATAANVSPGVVEWFEEHGQPFPPTPLDWARGPAKAWLAQLEPERREVAVRDLVERRRAEVPAYLRLADLLRLAARGWTIGGHGRDHLRLPDVDDRLLRSELDASVELLARVGASGPRLFAYPDGAHDQRTAKRVGAAGFDLAFTVEPGSVQASTSALALPRLFARGDSDIPHPCLGANA